MNDVKCNMPNYPLYYVIFLVFILIVPIVSPLDVLEIEKPSPPMKRSNSTLEESVAILGITADSTYLKKDEQGNIIKRYAAKNLLSEDYWCSAGNHGLNEQVELKVEFDQNVRLSAMWVHWAYAPGEYRIQYANKEDEEWKDIFPEKFRFSVEKGNMAWWKKILQNSQTRWHYKSFDTRIDFEETIFSKYMKLTMRIPVNRYFGIYNIEFYKKTKTVVMIKSLMKAQNQCLLVANGEFTASSPVISKDCIDAISFGDNRDLFVVQSNGLITLFSANEKCLQSSKKSEVTIDDCATAEEYKDDRHKWSVEYTGLIRSVKNGDTCLAINNEVPHIKSDKLIASASSTASDNTHSPDYIINYFSDNFWASEAVLIPVTVNIKFKNDLTFTVRSVNINWKFPAKNFEVIALMPDDEWKTFESVENNRETETEHFLMNTEIKAIKFVLNESTMKVEGKNIYAILDIFLKLTGNYVTRDKCGTMLMDANKWTLLDINFTDRRNGLRLKRNLLKMNSKMNRISEIKDFFKKIIKQVPIFNEESLNIDQKLKSIEETSNYYRTSIINKSSILSNEGSELNTIGSSILYPALGCSYIKIAFPHKRSGFYWIKEDCMPKPLYVFCDFVTVKQELMATNYYLIKLANEKEFSFINANSRAEDYIKEIRRKCADVGLFPVELTNLKQLKRISILLKEHDIDLGQDETNIVPVAFNYGYHKDSEENVKIFRSLNSKKSMKMSSIVDTVSEDEIKQDSELEQIMIDLLDEVIGKKMTLAFSTGRKLAYTTFKQTRIRAIVCSNNQMIKVDPNKKFKAYTDLNCKSTFKNAPLNSFAKNGGQIIVKCPRNCASVNSAEVYGTGVYTDDSSVCRAALHLGIIKDILGGVIGVSIHPGSESYKGSVQNGIETKDRDKYPRNFLVEEYNPVCPINIFISQVKDLSEFTEDSTQKVSRLSISEIKRLKKLIKPSHKNFLFKKIIFSSFLALEDGENRFIDNLNGKVENLNEKFNNIEKFENFEKFDKLASLLRLLQKRESKFQPKSEIQSLIDFTVAKKPITTDEALILIDESLKSKARVTEEALSLSNSLKKLMSNVNEKLVYYRDDPTIGINKQTSLFEIQKLKSEELQKMIIKLDSSYVLGVIKSEHDFFELKKNIDNLLRGQNFQEEFVNESISTNYNVFNSLTGSPITDPAVWDYFKLNLNGHQTVIRQSKKFADDRTGSQLVIKNRDFYDFEARCAVYIGKDQIDTFGVAFRYMDEYNYYVFEISKQERGFKRVRKFHKGESQVLDLRFDGGYNTDTWINIKIRAIMGQIQIFYTEDTSRGDIESSFIKVFDIYENSLIHGTIAFTSFNLNYLLIDSVSVMQIECTEVEDDRYSIDASAPECNRYREKFLHFSSNWKTYDPVKSQEGPSIWKRIKNQYNRVRLISQESSIYSTDQNEEGSFAVLQKVQCSSGIYRVKIYLTSKKSSEENLFVGLIFKFIDEDNFYVLEIGKKISRIRKKAFGKYSLLSVKTGMGFKFGEWFEIGLVMKQNKFNAYFTFHLDDQIKHRIFEKDVEDYTHRDGKVGLWTFRTAALFDGIEIDPIIIESPIIIGGDQIPLNEIQNKRHIEVKSHDKHEYNSIVENLNKNVKKFSWKKCLYNEDDEKRKRMCQIIFMDEISLERCEKDFCSACCSHSVQKGVTVHRLICVRQCQLLEKPITDKNHFDSCLNPPIPNRSIYNHCDKIFQFDFYQRATCKIDMCHLCCLSFRFSKNLSPKIQNISNEVFEKCRKDCTTKFSQKSE